MAEYLCEEDMNTGEYISRDEALKAMQYCCKKCDNYNGAMCRACDNADEMDIICDMPAADVQPAKRGRWIEKPPYKDETVKGLEFQIVCSECDEQNCSIEFDECYNPIGKTFYKTRFCPNCGAYMRETKKG